MRDRLSEWLAKLTGAPLGSAKLGLFIAINVWAAVWTANVVTTWAQTLVFRADNAATGKDSVDRWAKARGQWAVRLDKLEQACARR